MTDQATAPLEVIYPARYVVQTRYSPIDVWKKAGSGANDPQIALARCHAKRRRAVRGALGLAPPEFRVWDRIAQQEVTDGSAA